MWTHYDCGCQTNRGHRQLPDSLKWTPCKIQVSWTVPTLLDFTAHQHASKSRGARQRRKRAVFAVNVDILNAEAGENISNSIDKALFSIRGDTALPTSWGLSVPVKPTTDKRGTYSLTSENQNTHNNCSTKNRRRRRHDYIKPAAHLQRPVNPSHYRVHQHEKSNALTLTATQRRPLIQKRCMMVYTARRF